MTTVTNICPKCRRVIGPKYIEVAETQERYCEPCGIRVVMENKYGNIKRNTDKITYSQRCCYN